MWTRKEVKGQGLEAIKKNYWKCVIVALILSLLAGGTAGFSFSNGFKSGRSGHNGFHLGPAALFTLDGDELADDVEDALDEVEDIRDNDYDFDFDFDDDLVDIGDAFTGAAIGAAIVVGVIVFLIVFLIIFAIVMVVNAFVINPITVGGQRFFVRNLTDDVGVAELAYSFDHNYKNIAVTMFFRDLYVFFWSLLFVIPGIVKSYEYRMIPYLLADDPTMTKEQAFAISRQMMDGNKWKAFVLDLSFIGWHILGAMTFGILEIFFVSPYQYSTNAALYRRLLMNGNSGYGYTNPGTYYGQSAQAGGQQYYSQPANPAPEPEKVYYGQPDYTQPEFTKYDDVNFNNIAGNNVNNVNTDNTGNNDNTGNTDNES